MATAALITIEEIKKARSLWTKTVGFVPTMGALHEGHLALVKKAKELAGTVVVSVFVNPTQFGPTEDFARYPRTLKDDMEKLSALEVDAVFVPNAAEIYPDGFQTYVVNRKMSLGLCGASRPGHFEGVLTVVMKLFQLVKPDYAVFGKKDYQQLRLIEAMVKDLTMGVQIVPLDTLREKDGLAMSSRNRYLSSEDRVAAAHIYKGLKAAKEVFDKGECASKVICDAYNSVIKGQSLIIPEYAEVRNQTDLEIFSSEIKNPAVLLVAAKVSGIRLIDNIELG